MAEYIEREALWRAFEFEPFYDNADRDEIVLPKIDDFPAADVAPVVHGRWVDKLVRDWHCSECGKKVPRQVYFDGYYYADKLNYCPNCGAKMDGE